MHVTEFRRHPETGFPLRTHAALSSQMRVSFRCVFDNHAHPAIAFP